MNAGSISKLLRSLGDAGIAQHSQRYFIQAWVNMVSFGAYVFLVAVVIPYFKYDHS